MIHDIFCPYCQKPQEINHDDGYGRNEDELHSQECDGCGEEFKYQTSIVYNYDVFCQDSDHEMMEEHISGNRFRSCERCDFAEKVEDET